jgi:hypothetical protein
MRGLKEFRCVVDSWDRLEVPNFTDSDGDLQISITKGEDGRTWTFAAVVLSPSDVAELIQTLQTALDGLA